MIINIKLFFNKSVDKYGISVDKCLLCVENPL